MSSATTTVQNLERGVVRMAATTGGPEGTVMGGAGDLRWDRGGREDFCWRAGED